jgi:hypothetical protein
MNGHGWCSRQVVDSRIPLAGRCLSFGGRWNLQLNFKFLSLVATSTQQFSKHPSASYNCMTMTWVTLGLHRPHDWTHLLVCHHSLAILLLLPHFLPSPPIAPSLGQVARDSAQRREKRLLRQPWHALPAGEAREGTKAAAARGSGASHLGRAATRGSVTLASCTLPCLPVRRKNKR